MKHLYISVMGTIASGKTSISRLLSEQLQFHLIEENFGENAFLPRFYTDMKRWAFHSQTFYLMEKITQMRMTSGLLKKVSVVQDTPIVQDVYSYAQAQKILGNLDEAEWLLYHKIYVSYEAYLPVPHLIIYLQASISDLDRRIKKRGREYEKKIPLSYLRLLDTLNSAWIAKNKTIPVLSIDTRVYNIIRSRKDRQTVIDMVRKTIQNGFSSVPSSAA